MSLALASLAIQGASTLFGMASAKAQARSVAEEAKRNAAQARLTAMTSAMDVVTQAGESAEQIADEFRRSLAKYEVLRIDRNIAGKTVKQIQSAAQSQRAKLESSLRRDTERKLTNINTGLAQSTYNEQTRAEQAAVRASAMQNAALLSFAMSGLQFSQRQRVEKRQDELKKTLMAALQLGRSTDPMEAINNGARTTSN